MLIVHRTSVSVVIIFFLAFFMSFILLLSPCPVLSFAREVRFLCRFPSIPIKISCAYQWNPDQMWVFAATALILGFTGETHSFLLSFYKKRYVQLLAVSSMTAISHLKKDRGFADGFRKLAAPEGLSSSDCERRNVGWGEEMWSWTWGDKQEGGRKEGKAVVSWDL